MARTHLDVYTEPHVPEPRVHRVAARPLEAGAFASYGSVIEPGDIESRTLNRAPGQMAFMWVHRTLQYPDMPFVATCRYLFRGARCEYVQRHPESTVVLIPLDGQPSVIWFVPDRQGAPDVERAEAVLLDGHRGIVVAPGVWLRYAYPILASADFAYVSARVDPESDIERVYLERDHGVVLEWYMAAPSGQGVETTVGGAVLRLPLAAGGALDLGTGGVIIRDSAEETM
jgi:ureidoglycolate lyase